MSGPAKITGDRVVALAESWIGTPYRHQGAVQGVGCDCIGLIRGIWRALYGKEPEPVPAYAPDWAERSGEDRLADAAFRLFGAPLPLASAAPGDLLLFRWRPDCAAKHAGIFTDPSHFIHAYEQAAVTRSALVPSWRRRIAGVYRFPAARLDRKPEQAGVCSGVVSGVAPQLTVFLSFEVGPDGY